MVSLLKLYAVILTYFLEVRNLKFLYRWIGKSLRQNAYNDF